MLDSLPSLEAAARTGRLPRGDRGFMVCEEQTLFRAFVPKGEAQTTLARPFSPLPLPFLTSLPLPSSLHLLLFLISTPPIYSPLPPPYFFLFNFPSLSPYKTTAPRP